MGHRASRPIVVSIGVETKYVPIARERQLITVQGSTAAAGTVAVAWTSDNITRGPASSYDTNNVEHVAPASAEWTVLVADVVAAAVVGVPLQALALRLIGAVGASRVVITQSAE